MVVAVARAGHCPVNGSQRTKIIRMSVVKTQPVGSHTSKVKAKTLYSSCRKPSQWNHQVKCSEKLLSLGKAWSRQVAENTLQLVYVQLAVASGQTKPSCTFVKVEVSTFLCSLFSVVVFLADNTQNIYRVSPDGSLRVTFASGMEITLNTEPHILAGVVSPTLGKCNISLPGEHNSNLIEWRQRREQTKGNISTFERRLRVRLPLVYSAAFPLKAVELKSR